GGRRYAERLAHRSRERSNCPFPVSSLARKAQSVATCRASSRARRDAKGIIVILQRSGGKVRPRCRRRASHESANAIEHGATKSTSWAPRETPRQVGDSGQGVTPAQLLQPQLGGLSGLFG